MADPYSTSFATRITSLATALSCTDDADTVAAALFAHAHANTHDKGPRFHALATAIRERARHERAVQEQAVGVLADLA